MSPLAGVIGDPIGHSRSPMLHGYWLRRYGLPGQYVPLHVKSDDLRPALALLPRIGFKGVNVTLPHKEAVLGLADEVTPLARRIGSANTLTFQDGRILADNTDAYGFTWNILDKLPDWRPGCVALIGAGGASRAVIAALQDRGAREIRITNRNPERAQTLALYFGLHPVRWEDRAAMLEGCDALINATTLGMTRQPLLELPLDALPTTALVTDLIYTPLETPLLKCARVRGNVVVDGLGMLLYQAVPGFTRWFGREPEVDAGLRQAVLA